MSGVWGAGVVPGGLEGPERGWGLEMKGCRGTERLEGAGGLEMGDLLGAEGGWKLKGSEGMGDGRG